MTTLMYCKNFRCTSHPCSLSWIEGLNSSLSKDILGFDCEKKARTPREMLSHPKKMQM
jgi:hypothetical protein